MCLITGLRLKLQTSQKQGDQFLPKFCDGWYQKNELEFFSFGHKRKKAPFPEPLHFFGKPNLRIELKRTIKPFIFITGSDRNITFAAFE